MAGNSAREKPEPRRLLVDEARGALSALVKAAAQGDSARISKGKQVAVLAPLERLGEDRARELDTLIGTLESCADAAKLARLASNARSAT